MKSRIIILTIIIAGLLSWIAGSSGFKWEAIWQIIFSGSAISDQQSKTGPLPPVAVTARDAQKQHDSIGAVNSQVSLSAPAYLWRHGCGPTAVGMVIGYYDGAGYGDLVPGSAATQTGEVNQMIASGGDDSSPNPPGSERHYEDYARPEDAEPNMLDDDYITVARSPHPDDSVADYMDTSKSTESNYYGWSWYSDIGSSFVDYVHQQNPAYLPEYQSYTFSGGTLNWSILTTEIEAGRPMVFLVDSDGDGGTDHFVTVIGYRTEPTLQYGSWDTWSNTTVRWEDFAQIENGKPWGIYGGFALRLNVDTPTSTHTPTPTSTPIPTVTYTPTPTSTSIPDEDKVRLVKVWTADPDWNPKSEFKPGDSIKWVINVQNDTGAPAEMDITYLVKDPDGNVLLDNTTHETTDTGLWYWGLTMTVPAGKDGTHSFTGKVLYMGKTTQATTYYLVTSSQHLYLPLIFSK